MLVLIVLLCTHCAREQAPGAGARRLTTRATGRMPKRPLTSCILMRCKAHRGPKQHAGLSLPPQSLLPTLSIHGPSLPATNLLARWSPDTTTPGTVESKRHCKDEHGTRCTVAIQFVSGSSARRVPSEPWICREAAGDKERRGARVRGGTRGRRLSWRSSMREGLPRPLERQRMCARACVEFTLAPLTE